MYYTDNFKKLCKEVIKRQGHDTCFMSFSGGKDSLSSFLRIYETGLFSNYVLYYYYMIPDFSWTEEYFNYFEKKFGVRIIRVPNPILYKLWNNIAYQPPLRIRAMQDVVDQKGGLWLNYSLTELMTYVRVCEELPETTYCSVGVRSQDSMMRRMVIKKYGLINDNTKKWFPLHDFSLRDIVDILKKHDVYLPEDYDLFGLSFDGFDYRFLKPVSVFKPEDFKKIEEFYPMVSLKIVQMEKYYGYTLENVRNSLFMKRYGSELKVLNNKIIKNV